MTLDEWIDWLELDSDGLHLSKAERVELLEMLVELKKLRELQDEQYDDFLNDREREG